MGALAVIAMGSANGFMILRHYMLWDHSKVALMILCCAFALSYSLVFVFAVLTVKSFYEHAYYNPIVNTCLLVQKPTGLIGVWAAMCGFDLFAISMAVLNALQRPYRHTAEVVNKFKRDGAVLFVGLFLLRVLDLILAIALDKDEVFVTAFFVWCMVSITTCRLILRVAAIQSNSTHRREQS
ncbi:hypothetical protein BDW22DRAFT_321469 [Trametopsis cervina]|nr:hypothetical protein BDW22DRAFT_321469 [Trametopsis cervina]